MWSPERMVAGTGRIPALALLLAALAVAGCTVRPLYSDSAPAGSMVTGSIGAELSTIAIKPVGNRVGQEVRNHLVFLFGGGKGEPASPRYTLDLRVSAYSESTANIQVNEQNEPTAALMNASAVYTLTDSSGKVVSSGSREFRSSYDVPRQEFAAYRAQIDAENRAARELAELVRMAIAQDLAKPPAKTTPPA